MEPVDILAAGSLRGPHSGSLSDVRFPGGGSSPQGRDTKDYCLKTSDGYTIALHTAPVNSRVTRHSLSIDSHTAIELVLPTALGAVVHRELFQLASTSSNMEEAIQATVKRVNKQDVVTAVTSMALRRPTIHADRIPFFSQGVLSGQNISSFTLLGIPTHGATFSCGTFDRSHIINQTLCGASGYSSVWDAALFQNSSLQGLVFSKDPERPDSPTSSFKGTEFRNCAIENCSWREADLSGVIFSNKTRLENCDLRNSRCGGIKIGTTVTLENIDLSGALFNGDEGLIAWILDAPVVELKKRLKNIAFSEKPNSEGTPATRFHPHPETNAKVYQKLHDVNKPPRSAFARPHYLFEPTLRLLNAKDTNQNPLNLALVGPAGTGKTSMALAASNALGIEPLIQAFNPQTTKSDLMGYMDAQGRYVKSPLYVAMKEGRLFVADEFDSANAAVATILNSAVAQREVTFPNLETVAARPEFRAVFCMNTYGTGADDRYTGRTRLDAATLDRLVYLHVPIDPGLEATLAGVSGRSSPKVDITEGGLFSSQEALLAMIVGIRRSIEHLNKRAIVSPRATLHATAMHRAGFGINWILECCVWRGMSPSDRKAILEHLASKQ